jgi:hypothetical protein
LVCQNAIADPNIVAEIIHEAESLHCCRMIYLVRATVVTLFGCGTRRANHLCQSYGSLFSKNFKLVGYQIFWLLTYRVKVIPETRRVD